jgi:hypothetical protein
VGGRRGAPTANCNQRRRGDKTQHDSYLEAETNKTMQDQEDRVHSGRRACTAAVATRVERDELAFAVLEVPNRRQRAACRTFRALITSGYLHVSG